MLKHSYHARLSIWHVVLLVIILAISLPVIAKPASSSKLLPVFKTSRQLPLEDMPPQLQQKDNFQLPGGRLLST
ncbi:MAG: hypothetical protein OEU74_07485 [Gammaproteobacteria bacterium]|nr:hypothetical protein [Gammaproteobacteria bacterium]